MNVWQMQYLDWVLFAAAADEFAERAAKKTRGHQGG